MLERIFERARIQAVISLGRKENSRIDRSGSGRHDQTLKRGHAHRGAGGSALPHRRDRAASAEMRHDHTEIRAFEERRGPLDGPADRETVEAITPVSPVRVPLEWDRVDIRLLRQCRVEPRVECRGLGDFGKRASCRFDDRDGDRIVQRREPSQLADAPEHVVIDDRGVREARPTVHDAMPDRTDGREIGPGRRHLVEHATHGRPGVFRRPHRNVDAGLGIVGALCEHTCFEGRRACVEDEQPAAPHRPSVGCALACRITRPLGGRHGDADGDRD